jgi:hypothetical protein
MIFVIEKFLNETDSAVEERVYYEYEEAQAYVLQEVMNQQKHHYSNFTEEYPDPRIKFDENGMTIKFRAYPQNLILKVSEKEI